MAQFTGALNQKSHNGQDHFRCGRGWGVVCDGHGDHKGRQAAEISGNRMANDIEFAIQQGKLREFVANLPAYGSERHEELRKYFLADHAFDNGKGIPMGRYDGKVVRGGTTCTAVIHLKAEQQESSSAASASSSSESVDEKHEDDKLVFAWVGDSSGKIFLELDDGQVQVIDATEDHSADNVTEFHRIKALRESGQEVGDLFYSVKVGEPCIPIFDAEGNKIDYFSSFAEVERTTNEYHTINALLQKDPQNQVLKDRLQSALTAYHDANRVYLASDQYKQHSQLVRSTAKPDGYGSYITHGKEVSLAMTRSWGDFASHQVGVIPTMEVKEFIVKDLPAARRRIAFVASDGVHDCYTDEELAKLVLSGKSTAELKKAFVAKSCAMFGGKQADDISFVLAEF
jgi:serine/threonine protein phosphatase PrpC